MKCVTDVIYNAIFQNINNVETRFLAFSITTYLITVYIHKCIYYNTNHNMSNYFKASVLIKKKYLF